jgi:hypothetical protein
MNGEGSRPSDSEIGDFAEMLKPLDGTAPPVLVGGHAVGFWSRHFLRKGQIELFPFLPFRSKDLDLLGDSVLLERLHHHFRGRLQFSEPRSPVFGRLEIPTRSGRVLRIEVLHTVHGLGPKDLQRTVDVEVDGIAARTLLPHIVLKAKLANAAKIPQDGRQDVKHTRMMLLCVRGFIEEVLQGVRDGSLVERAAVNLLEEIFEIVGSPVARQAAERWNLDLGSIWPLGILLHPASPKVARWAEHRLGMG